MLHYKYVNTVVNNAGARRLLPIYALADAVQFGPTGLILYMMFRTEKANSEIREFYRHGQSRRFQNKFPVGAFATSTVSENGSIAWFTGGIAHTNYDTKLSK